MIDPLAWIGRHLPDIDNDAADDLMKAICVVGTALWGSLALDALIDRDDRAFLSALAYVGLGWAVRGLQYAGLRWLDRRRDRLIARLERRERGDPS